MTEKEITRCPDCNHGMWVGGKCSNVEFHEIFDKTNGIFEEIKEEVGNDTIAMEAAKEFVAEYSGSHLKKYGLAPKRSAAIKRKFHIPDDGRPYIRKVPVNK